MKGAYCKYVAFVKGSHLTKRRNLLLIMLIVVSLFLTPVAVAYDYEYTVFETIYHIYTDPDMKLYLGEPEFYESDEDSGICWIFFNANYGTISLVGEDIYEEPHCVFWSGLSAEEVDYACEVICILWDELDETAELYGHELAIEYLGLNQGKYIFNKTDANEFLGIEAD